MTARESVCGRLQGLPTIALLAVAALISQATVAQPQPQPEVLEYKGIVAAAREAEVAPRLDGLLSKIHFKAGQTVKQGDLLFEFASTSNELSLDLARASLKQAEAQLQLADVNLRNARTLRTRNVASEMQELEAQAQRDIAAAKAEEARANMRLAEVALSQVKLYAPISGIVSRPFIREGAYITREARDQSRLATVVQLDPILVVGKAPAEKYFQRGEALKTLEQAAEEREFNLLLPTGDAYSHKGRLVAGAYEFNPETQTTEVTVEFPNPDYVLRPGLGVTLQSLVRAR